MKTAPRFIAATALLLLLGATVQAQEPDPTPYTTQPRTTLRNDFRAPGYKGNVTLTDFGFIVPGIETSHGYMFDRSNYLGGGVGAYSYGFHQVWLGGFFLDYTHYMRDAQNTFVVGTKLGALFDVTTFETPLNPYIEPAIGWNWMQRNGTGITLTLSVLGALNEGDPSLAPKLSVSLEF